MFSYLFWCEHFTQSGRVHPSHYLLLFRFTFTFSIVFCVLCLCMRNWYCERLIDCVCCCWKSAFKCVDFSVRYFIWLLFYCDIFICFSLLPSIWSVSFGCRFAHSYRGELCILCLSMKKSFGFYSSILLSFSRLTFSKKGQTIHPL